MVASFKRKVVFVTGGGSGIGQALAVAFARKGAKLSALACDDFADGLGTTKDSGGPRVLDEAL
jgi:NAD(P)-dependent dehydrogenase (short-subunit alcohol dehydrogenase family)